MPGQSQGRAHQVHRTIRAALNEALKRKHITANPATIARAHPRWTRRKWSHAPLRRYSESCVRPGPDGHGVIGWSNSAMAARYQHIVAAIRRDVATQVGGLLWEQPDSNRTTGEAQDGSGLDLSGVERALLQPATRQRNAGLPDRGDRRLPGQWR